MRRTANPLVPVVAVAVAISLAGCPDEASTVVTPDTTPDAADVQADVTADTGPDTSSPGVPVVTTKAGPVEGEVAGDLHIYRGIPYAAPPVGDLRFKAPESPEPWTDTLQALDFGPACPQGTTLLGDPGPTSEDCLTLNVWAPQNGVTRKPVMVWIHGGGFDIGSSNESLYEGTRLATSADVVLVSINYRLGPLGFLATDAALNWVQDNIAAFGGDPLNVTIFGESAGGASVCILMGAPAAVGTFSQAIIQSGGGCYGVRELRDGSPQQTPAVSLGAEYSIAAGCDSAADEVVCLRGLTVDEIMTAVEPFKNPVGLTSFGPNIDGLHVPDDTYDLVEAGAIADIPVLIGANADEMELFSFGQTIGLTEYDAVLAGYPTDVADALRLLYPATTDEEARAAAIRFGTDRGFVCPALAFAALSAGGSAPTFH